MNVTWRTLGTHCRELDWSKQRLLHELQNGLPYRTIPPGHVIDWHHPDVQRSLDVERSEVMINAGGVLFEKAEGAFILGLDCPTVGVEVLPPTDAEMPSPPEDTPEASAQWAQNAVRKLRAENKLPRDIKTKAELARLLEKEAQKDVRTGRIRRALRASYIENQLEAWGIWPLDSFN